MDQAASRQLVVISLMVVISAHLNADGRRYGCQEVCDGPDVSM